MKFVWVLSILATFGHVVLDQLVLNPKLSKIICSKTCINSTYSPKTSLSKNIHFFIIIINYELYHWHYKHVYVTYTWKVNNTLPNLLFFKMFFLHETMAICLPSRRIQCSVALISTNICMYPIRRYPCKFETQLYNINYIQCSINKANTPV